MKYKVRIICNKERAIGFRLSSFSGIIPVDTKKEAKNQLLYLAEQSDVGLIIIYDDLILENDPEILEIQRSHFPLLVIIPNSKTTDVDSEEKMLELLRHSIGISVKI